MPIINEQLSDEPNIIISRIEEPFNLEKDTAGSLKQLAGFLEATTGTVYVIADCRKLSPSFSDVVMGLAQTSQPGSPLRNERMETIVVATGQIFTNMVAWYKQQHYGQLEMQLYQTLDEAISHAKSKLGKR
jgi:hypothetical protein